MATVRVPSGLGKRGRRLWRDLTVDHDFPPAELVLLEEACRLADRLDRLDMLIQGSDREWLTVLVSPFSSEETVTVKLMISDPMSEARQSANILKQLLAALRIPDEVTGKRPQQRGGARGAYRASGAKTASGQGGATVSALDRARAARGA